MLTYNITGFFDTIPHAYLIQTMHTLHVPLPIVWWTYSFLQNRKATIRLDKKQDPLAPINTGVPQGSCASPILAMYFTAPLNEAIHRGTMTRIANHTHTLNNLQTNWAALLPHTLYVDDGAISASAHSREETTLIVQVAFESAHKWLRNRGLKTDQVKCKLIHFTKSNRGWHEGEGLSITIPTNVEGETRDLTPSKTIKYLGMWINSRLTLTEHVRKTTSKAMSAAHALRLLGNSERGIHQTLWCQLYYRAILPIALYGLPLYWHSKNGQTLNQLRRLQNECLHLITGAFKTTPTTAMEIKASIPPIKLFLEYKLDMESLCLSCLDNNHPILSRTPLDLCRKLPKIQPPLTPAHLTHHGRSNRTRKPPRTCISRIASQAQENTERTQPLATVRV